jgi:hypothetical protein
MAACKSSALGLGARVVDALDGEKESSYSCRFGLPQNAAVGQHPQQVDVSDTLQIADIERGEIADIGGGMNAELGSESECALIATPSHQAALPVDYGVCAWDMLTAKD